MVSNDVRKDEPSLHRDARAPIGTHEDAVGLNDCTSEPGRGVGCAT